MFLGTRRKLFLQPESFCLLSKNDVENFFFETLSSESIYRHVKCSFFKPAEKRKKLAGKPIFFPVIVRKRIEIVTNFLENAFRRSVPMDT